MNKLFLFLVLLISQTGFGQREIIVQDGIDDERLPFVKVKPDQGNPGFTNIDGIFLLDSATTSFSLHMMGYKDTLIVVKQLMSDTIRMWGNAQDIAEVKVVAGENPAHRIMDSVILNRKRNHPLSDDAFTYQSYSKFIFDTNEEFKNRVTNQPKDDTTDLSLLTDQHLFMMESATERRYIPPAKDREDIVAYKVSGLKLPIFATFAQSLQAFNFYDNEFELGGAKYVNPIAKGGTKRYLFILKDTTVIGTDTTFTITYRPRRNKEFKGMYGTLYINTNGYAIEKVIASPYPKDSLTIIKIVQDYRLIDGEKWFPYNLSTQIEFKNLAIAAGSDAGYIMGKGNTYIKNVQLNPADMNKRGFGNVSIATNPDANQVTEEEWEQYRERELNDYEKKTYDVIDSLAESVDLDRKLTALMALMTGKLRLGKVNILLGRIVDFNLYEGFRLGAGLETSELLMKNIAIGGYVGWGTKDNEWKYGGYSTFYINRRQGIELTLKYQQDLVHRGQNDYTQKGFDFSNTEVYSRIYRKNMDRQRLAELSLAIAPLGNMKLIFTGNYQRVEFTKGYVFHPLDSMQMIDSRVDVAETSVEFQWFIREKVKLLGDIRIPVTSNFPKIYFKITQGWKGIAESQFDYTRLSLKVNQRIQSLRFGEFEWCLMGSQTVGEVPLFLNQNSIGTRSDWYLTAANRFETVFPGEFFHDKQASLFLRYGFPRIKTKLKWFNPQFTLHHGAGYGSFDKPEKHSFRFKSMNQGLFEAGLIFNGMLETQYTSLGLGLFYRYGVYAESKVEENLVPKFSVKFSLQ